MDLPKPRLAPVITQQVREPGTNCIFHARSQIQPGVPLRLSSRASLVSRAIPDLSVIVILSAYHLNGIFGGFFWTNGTAPFFTKKTERIEPYHLIRSFGCKCFPAPLSSKARIMQAKVKHKNRRPI